MRRSLAVLTLLTGTALADKAPTGMHILDGSKSPDGKLAVAITDEANHKDKVVEKIVDVATGAEIATIAVPAGVEGGQDFDPKATWSKGGDVLVWTAAGKWGSQSLVVVELDRGKVTKQIDVRTPVVIAAAAAAKAARPKQYAAIKAASAGFGSWYKDGLAIDVTAGAASFPLAISISIDSDVKGMVPDMAKRIRGGMTATVTAAGKISYDKFASELITK
jgi:hypothetical protein